MNVVKEILALLLPVLRGAAAFFELRNRQVKYQLIRESEEKQNQLIAKIEELRGNKNSNSSLLADSLRKDLKREKDLYQDILNNEL